MIVESNENDLRESIIQYIDISTDTVLSQSRAFADHAVHYPAFSPTESLLAQGIYKSLAFYSQPSMEFIRSVSHESDKLAFSTGGETLVSAGPDGSLTLFDAHTGDLLRTLPSAFGPVHALAVGIQAAAVVITHATQPPQLWHTSGDQQPIPLTGHNGSALAVDISSNGTLFTGGEDKVLKQWNSETGAWSRDVFTTTQPIRSIARTPNELVLLLGLADNTAVLLSLDNGQVLGTFTGNSDQVDLSRDGKWILVGTHLWNRAENNLVHIFEGHTGIITSVQFSHDAQAFVTHGEDKTNRVWDLREYIGSGVEDWGKAEYGRNN